MESLILCYTSHNPMFERFYLYAKDNGRQFGKYFFVGVSGVVLDLVSLTILKEKFGIRPVAAVVINQAGLLVYNYCLNKYWTFKNKRISHQEVIRYAALAVANYIFSVAVMYLLNERLGLHYQLVRLGTIAVMVSWNFFLYKYWVYRAPLTSPTNNEINHNNVTM